MSRSGNLAKNTIIIFIGTLCTKLISFLLLPLYTGLLTPKEYGVVDLLTTLVSLLIPIISLQIEQGLFRFLIENREDNKKKKELITTGIVFVLINILIYFIIFLALCIFIKNEYKFYLLINVIACLISTVFLQISRGLGKNKEYSFAGFLIATITIVSNIIFLVLFKMKTEGILIGMFLGYLCGIVYLFFSLKLYNFISLCDCNFSVFKKLIKYSLPLVPNQLSWWVFDMSDRVIVTSILGLSFTGILAVGYKFSNVYILLYNIFILSWTESIALHINDDDIHIYFNKVFNTMLIFFASLGVFIISCLPLVFNLFVNKSFSESYYLIPIAIMSAIFQSIVGLVSVVYAANKNTKALANTGIFSALLNISIHLILIHFIGIFAAVVSTLTSYLFFAIYRTRDINKKYFKIHFNIKKLVLLSIILIISLLEYYMGNFYIKIIGFILVIIGLLILNRDSIDYISNILLKKIHGKAN